MAHIPINFGGGSGSGSDDCTAKKEHVLAPYTAITSDSDDEPIVGGLKDNSGVTKSAAASLDTTNSRVQLTVPETAKYNLTSKLYATYAAIRSLIGLTAAKIISGNTILGLAGTATSDATISKSKQLLKDVVAYGKNGVKYVGEIASLAAKTYTPGTSNQTIAAGQYLSGAQTIKGDSNLKAANIKKGVSIFGITGTWEGYVADTLSELYKYGNNAAGLSLSGVGAATYKLLELCIQINSGGNGTAYYADLTSNKTYSFMNYTKLNIVFKALDGARINFCLLNGSTEIAENESYASKNADTTISLDISSFNETIKPIIRCTTNNVTIEISKISLS